MSEQRRQEWPRGLHVNAKAAALDSMAMAHDCVRAAYSFLSQIDTGSDSVLEELRTLRQHVGQVELKVKDMPIPEGKK